MINLHINPRFATKFKPLPKVAFDKLESDMLDDLTTEPIFYWHNPKTDQDELIEGHHRYQIAQKHGIELQTHEKFFESEDEVVIWIIFHQIGRRNLEIEDRKAAYAEAVELARKETDTTNAPAIAAVAQVADVSKRTIYRALESKPEPEPIDPLAAEIAEFQAQKKDFELRVAKRKEAVTKEFVARCREEQREPQEDDEETLRESLEREFEAEQENLTQRSDTLQEKLAEAKRAQEESSQVGGRGSGKGAKKGRKYSRSKELIREQKTALKALKTAGNKFQTALMAARNYFDEIDNVRLVEMFGQIEAIEKRMEVPRFGKKR
jgi:hypothetical protein